MKCISQRVLFAVPVLSMFLSCALPAAEANKRQDLVTCGWDKVEAFRLEGTVLTPLWSWTPSSSNLPATIKTRFTTTSECKSAPDGRVLITSSGGNSLDGAVAVIYPNSPPTSNVQFYARTPNAHSADFLPGNRIAVALSYHPNGNRMAVFDLNIPDVEILSVPLFGAHGVIWDSKRHVLWGLADTFINKYELKDWTSAPQLRLLSSTPLPDIGGHEMMVGAADSPFLTISTGLNCWYFDRDTLKFTKHPSLGQTSNVKGISTHPFTSRTVFVQSEINWWSDKLHFKDPDLTILVPGEHFYKARWVTPACDTSGIDSGGGFTNSLTGWNHSSIGASFATRARSIGTRSGLINVIFPQSTAPPPYSIPVEWQIAHFGENPVDPLDDPDHDGTNNFMEYLAGTNPLDAGSVFQPVGSYQDQAYWITMPTESGRNYEIWGTGDLQSWTLIQTIQGDGGIKKFIFNTSGQPDDPESSPPLPAAHFFRVNITKP